MFDAHTIDLADRRDLAVRTPLSSVLFALGLVACAGAIGAGAPRLVALGAPFFVVLALAAARWQPVQGTIRIGIDVPRVVEGSAFNVLVEVNATGPDLERIEIELSFGSRVVAATRPRIVAAVRSGTSQVFEIPVRAESWGLDPVGLVTIRTTDRFGVFGGQVKLVPSLSIRVGLPDERSQSSLDADRFRRVVGTHLGDDRGQGLEIADVRRLLPGDSVRDINWRITNRRREPWVTLRHPDRSASVVVIVDAQGSSGDESVEVQRRSVEAALTLARGHLASHDPVGLLVVGHTVGWLPPRLGRNQMHRIADELISVGVASAASLRRYRPRALPLIPREAIVVAVSPLRDPRMVGMLAELANRGNSVSVLVPATTTAKHKRRDLAGRRGDNELARRLAATEQKTGIHSLRRHSIVVVPWSADQPVTAVFETVRRLHRSSRRVGVR